MIWVDECARAWGVGCGVGFLVFTAKNKRKEEQRFKQSVGGNATRRSGYNFYHKGSESQ